MYKIKKDKGIKNIYFDFVIKKAMMSEKYFLYIKN
jgi:hypothetical protein